MPPESKPAMGWKDHLEDVFELSEIYRETWPLLRPTGLVCEGEGDGGGDGGGSGDGGEGEGADEKGGDGGKSGDGGSSGSEEVPADIEAIASQAKNPDAVRKALMAERRKATEAEERAAELVKKAEREKLSEHERTKADLADAKSEVDTLKTENLRLRVAIAKELPLSLADRLKGKNQKEMEADADELLEQLGKKDEKPQGDGDGGRGEGGGGDDNFNARLRKQYAGR